MPPSLAWTPEEDDMLRELVEQHGTKAWAKIASIMRTKGSKQCRRRWKNSISMAPKTCSWSAEEDAILLDAHRRLGNRWTEISKIFGDRTDNAVKNRWHALARKHPGLERADDSDDQPRRKRRRTRGAAADEEDEDSELHSAQYQSGHSLQFTNSGGISAAALPTPFDQPGGLPRAAVAAGLAGTAAQATGAHPMALHEQQAAAAAAYMAALQAQAQQAAAAQDQYTAAMAAAAAEHAYLVCPPPAQQAPLHIMVGKDYLSPWEQQLAEQINAMNLPVHVEVAPAPMLPIAPESLLPEALTAPELLPGRSSWQQYVDRLDEPGDSKGLQELLDWFSGSTTPSAQHAQQQQQQQARQRQAAQAAAQAAQQAAQQMPPPGFGSRRLTRSLSKNNSGGSSLSDEQKELLVKLMSRGLEARTSAEEAAAGGGFSGALSGFPAMLSGLGSAGSLSRRFDPMKRTRSSGAGLRSNDMERAAAQLVQQAGLAAQAAAQAAAAQSAAGPSARDAAPPAGAAAAAIGFRGFPKLSSGGGSSGGGHSLTRAISKRRASGTAGGAAGGLGSGPPSILLLEPSPIDRGFSDVLVTPAFSSNEIKMLLEALNPPK